MSCVGNSNCGMKARVPADRGVKIERWTSPARTPVGSRSSLDFPVNGSPPDLNDYRPLVLVVDDEEMIRSLVRSVLESNGYRVDEADCAREAIERVEVGLDAVDLLITDVRMPGQSGPELAKVLRARWPEIPIVFISGYSGEAPIERTPSPITEYLAKPFPLPALLAAVRRLLAADRVAV